MEIRPLTPDDLPALAHIASRSFRKGEVPVIGPEALNGDGRSRIGVFENGRLEAQLTILDFQMFFGEQIRPCGGIAGVMCEPAARGKGYAGALIRGALQQMRERGQYLSSLWPFEFGFYQAYGWDWVGVGRKYRMPLRLLPADAAAGSVSLITEGFEERLNPIYVKQAARYHGAMVRGSRLWKSILEPWNGRSAAAYVYREGGEDQGYAIIRYEKEKEAIQASDFVALTPQAYRGLLDLFRRHAMSAKKISWWGPEDDPFWSHYYNWDVKTELWPRAMGRIVDVEAALRALEPAAGLAGEVIVKVQDDRAEWNAKTWRIEIGGSRAAVLATSAEAGVVMDIRALTQAYWGKPSLLELRSQGWLEVRSEPQFELLSTLLPSAIVWLADDF